jgi:hypothetical protein
LWKFCLFERKQRVLQKGESILHLQPPGRLGDILAIITQERTVVMKNTNPREIIATASIDLDGREVRMDKLAAAENGHPDIHIVAAPQGQGQAGPLVLTEEQLIELLHKASHAGVLSHAFFGKLREAIEI